MKQTEALEYDMLLMIDNYDSFTYNLVQYFGELGADVRVYRNDAPVLPPKPVFRLQRSSTSPANFRFWASVWGIRALAPLSGVR